MQGVLASA